MDARPTATRRMSSARVHPMAVVSPDAGPRRASTTLMRRMTERIAPSEAALVKEEADANEPSWKNKTLALFFKSPLQ